MDEITHIVPVGHTPETLIDSLRRFPVNRVVFILVNKPELGSEKKARLVAEKVKEALGTIPCEEIYVDPEDMFSAAMLIARKINEESTSRKIKVNLSGSLRTIGIASYIATLLTGTEAYVGVPKYEKDNAVGISEIIDIPLIPIKELSPGKVDILNVIGESEKSLDGVINQLNPKLKPGSSEYINEKSRISHHLKDLRKDKFVETDKDGRNLRITLTNLGELYLLKKI